MGQEMVVVSALDSREKAAAAGNGKDVFAPSKSRRKIVPRTSKNKNRPQTHFRCISSLFSCWPA